MMEKIGFEYQTNCYLFKCIKNKSSNIYVNALDLISGVNRDLLNLNRNYESYQEVEHSINSKITNFELFIDEDLTNTISHFTNSIKKSVRIITTKCETLEEKKVNKIRGLLTEAVACSYLGDVRYFNQKILSGLQFL